MRKLTWSIFPELILLFKMVLNNSYAMLLCLSQAAIALSLGVSVSVFSPVFIGAGSVVALVKFCVFASCYLFVYLLVIYLFICFLNYLFLDLF
jgi:hypothetical protein